MSFPVLSFQIFVFLLNFYDTFKWSQMYDFDTDIL